LRAVAIPFVGIWPLQQTYGAVYCEQASSARAGLIRALVVCATIGKLEVLLGIGIATARDRE